MRCRLSEMHCGGVWGKKQAFYKEKKKERNSFQSSQIYMIMFLTILLLY